jgi:Cu-processing system ATP-binding protein
MRMIGCVSRPSGGQLRILGMDPRTQGPAIRARLGVVPQRDTLDEELTVEENIFVYGRYFGLSKQVLRERTRELLEFAQLTERATSKVEPLSGGMKRRLTIARSLINSPKILLLDEPTTGLDPELRQTFYDIIARLAAAGTTVLLSSHALTELEERAGRVIIMNRGIKVADGSIGELRRLARLPTRIRLKVAGLAPSEMPGWAPQDATCRRLNGHIVEIDAAPERKIELLHRATAAGNALEDVDVVPPTLDELYAHFLRQSEQAP